MLPQDNDVAESDAKVGESVVANDRVARVTEMSRVHLSTPLLISMGEA
jgi:hypothetical protein